ncbi:MAG: hypothetical protein INH41_08040 [Myxococcaceae bacterium]|nr:hypothetical protein [Myxococcaceae bacterium]
MNDIRGKTLRLSRELLFTATSPSISVTKLQPNDVEGIREHMRTHGWVIIRKLFTSTEALAMRDGVLRSKRELLTGDLLSNPHLRTTLLDSRFLTAVKTVVGPKPVYFGDSNWSADYYPGTIGFHKDNPDKENQSAPDWASDYTIFRFGIYLHDCTQYSGGLCLRDKSHNSVSVTRGQSFAVPTEPGDVVAWSHRTTHSGYATRLRLLPKVFLPLQLVARLATNPAGYMPPPALFRGLQYPERLALFASFGRRDAHLERYVRYLCTRQYYVQSVKDSVWKPEAVEQANTAGLDLLSLHEQLRNVDVSKLNKDHVPLPS